jgi:hypothetical protein
MIPLLAGIVIGIAAGIMATLTYQLVAARSRHRFQLDTTLERIRSLR